MSQVCPECASNDTIHFLAEVGHQVCSNCGTVFQDLQLYQPTDAHDVAYALGAPQQQRASSSLSLGPFGPGGKPFWSGDREHQRHISERRHKPEVDARIRGTLSRIGHPGLFQQVEFLFQRARDESWKPAPDRHANEIVDPGDSATDHDTKSSPTSDSVPPRSVLPRVRWGNSSVLLATACCYVVLRRQGVHTDLRSVSDAAQLPYPKVRLAFKRLRLLVRGAVQNIRLADPDAFVRRIVAFFCCHLIHTNYSPLSSSVRDFLQPFRGALPDVNGLLKLDPARIFHKTPFEAVEATALDLCTFWWPSRHPSASGQLAAFAAVVLAFEAHLKALAPIWDIFCCTYAALDFDPRSLPSSDPAFTTTPANGDAVFSRNAKECYKEICAALKEEAAKIPWLSDAAPISQKRRSKLRLGRQNAEGMSDLGRLDVVIYALDVLDVRRGLSSQGVRHDHGSEPVSWDKQEAARRGSAHHGQETRMQDSPERELDDDELDCFLSTSPRSASKMRQGLSDDDPYPTTEDAGDETEVWPRVQQRLEAAGALFQRDVDPHSSSFCHPIDLLTDEQVDDLLFDSNEISSFFRTDPVERAVFERAKVAAGDWPSQAKDERDAEFATLARSLETNSLPPANPKAERNSSTPPSSPAAALEGDTTRKQAAEATEPAVANAAATAGSLLGTQKPSQSTSTLRPSKRVKAPLAEVSLREQEEESDWSD